MGTLRPYIVQRLIFMMNQRPCIEKQHPCMMKPRSCIVNQRRDIEDQSPDIAMWSHLLSGRRYTVRVRAITPVPGGVGPMTIALLMKTPCKPRGRSAQAPEK